MVILWLCLKYRCARVQNNSYGMEISEFHLGYIEPFYECSNLLIMYTLTLLKSFGFFMTDSWTQNILSLQFL
jgi:hypothetical protein